MYPPPRMEAVLLGHDSKGSEHNTAVLLGHDSKGSEHFMASVYKKQQETLSYLSQPSLCLSFSRLLCFPRASSCAGSGSHGCQVLQIWANYGFKGLRIYKVGFKVYVCLQKSSKELDPAATAT